jgi:hypothetical protein
VLSGGSLATFWRNVLNTPEADSVPFSFNPHRFSWNLTVLKLNKFVSEDYLLKCDAVSLVEIWRRFGGTSASIFNMEQTEKTSNRQ